jgi:hypothetical protein
VRETRTLRAMRRGLQTAYGAANEALPTGNGEKQIGRTNGAQRQSSTLPGRGTDCAETSRQLSTGRVFTSGLISSQARHRTVG